MRVIQNPGDARFGRCQRDLGFLARGHFPRCHGLRQSQQAGSITTAEVAPIGQAASSTAISDPLTVLTDSQPRPPL